ncbi:unnamed protein product [Calypogeia fissa]
MSNEIKIIDENQGVRPMRPEPTCVSRSSFNSIYAQEKCHPFLATTALATRLRRLLQSIRLFNKGPGHHQESQPRPLLIVVSEANKNYRLTSRPDGVVLAYKIQQDPKQYWYKVDYGDKFVDEEGSRAFILVNKATGQALSHGHESGAIVTQEPYKCY